MRFQECELEFAISAEVEKKGGVQIYVLNLGGGSKNTDSHRIKLKFSALAEIPVIAVGKIEGDAAPVKRQTPDKD